MSRIRIKPLHSGIFPLALAMCLAIPQPAQAADTPAAPPLHAQVADRAEGEMRTFYAHTNGPLWVSREGRFNPAAQTLLALVKTAEYDGVDPDDLHLAELTEAIRLAEAEPSPSALADAELHLSRTFVAYVAALRQIGETEMFYEHDALRPYDTGAYFTLDKAAKAPSLADYVRDMRWMHPLYAPLRRTLLDDGQPAAAKRLAIRNLERIRQIPPQPTGRHVLVDTASARLWMYEGDRLVDSMRVVVGKPENPTPSMSGWIRYAIANPYWNVPKELVRKTIANNVLSQGVPYLKNRGYQVLSGWEEDARLLDPTTIDWRAVRRGDVDVRVRQLPGGPNAMGEMKFEFPNPLGIYLHDTPEKGLLTEEARYFSAGCVRLEDAKRLGKWLMEGALVADSTPEKRIDLPEPVPIYITYLTARAEGDRIAAGPDPYGRDGAEALAIAANTR